MSALDQYEPLGKRIHPYDIYAMLVESPEATTPVDKGKSPEPEDAADYFRNKHKLGHQIEMGGELYFETTSEPPVTKLVGD